MSDPVVIECPECNARMKIADSSKLGKKVACPKCKSPFVAKAVGTAKSASLAKSQPVAKAKPAAKPKPADEDDWDDNFDDEPAPAKKKGARLDDSAALPGKKKSSKEGDSKGKKKGKSQGSPLGLYVGGGVGAVLLIGLLVWFLLPGAKPAAPPIAKVLPPPPAPIKNKLDLAWLPGESNGFLVLKAGELLDSPFAKSLLSLFPDLQGMLQRPANDGFPFTLQDVDSAIVAFKLPADQLQPPFERAIDAINNAAAGPPAMPSPASLMGGDPFLGVVVRLKKDAPVPSPEKFNTVTYNNATYYAGKTTADYFYLPKPNIIVSAASEVKLKVMIDRGEKIDRRADLDFIDTAPQLLFVGTNHGLPALPSVSAGPTGPMPVNGTSFGLKSANGLDLAYGFQTPDPAAKQKLQEQSQKLGELLKQKHEEVKGKLPPNIGTLVELLVTSWKVANGEGTVSVQIGLPETALTNIAGVYGEVIPLLLGGALPPGVLPGVGGPPQTPPGQNPSPGQLPNPGGSQNPLPK